MIIVLNEEDIDLYSKFNLEMSNNFCDSETRNYFYKGQQIYEKYQKDLNKQLKSLVFDGDKLDGTTIQKNWFDAMKADVFLSHSHKDIDQVKAFAGWLYENFNLVAFIDSCVWGYCDDLLKEIDNTFCKNSEDNTYDYNLRNHTTSHVHIMLATAITEMIDNTECIIFINTPNAISLSNDIDKIQRGENKVTLSPWIYHELAMTSVIRRRELKDTRKKVKYEKFSESVGIEHEVNRYLKNMISINERELMLWKNKYKKFNGFSLDLLYDIVYKSFGE